MSTYFIRRQSEELPTGNCQLQTANCQLIISDIMMPVMDGFQLLEKLKSDDRWRHLPVIMLTARAEMRDKLKALRIGVDDYMLKPFEEEELLVRIENLLKNSRERQLAATEGSPDNFGTGSGQLAETPNAEPGTPKPEFTAEDLEWLEQLENTTKDQLPDFQFKVEYLAREMAYGRHQLNRRIKQLTGLTAAEYILEARFLQARSWLETGKFASVKAVALEAGLKDFKYFSRQFKRRFGKLPSLYF